jgi:putative tricarboxylic transport membrane protein
LYQGAALLFLGLGIFMIWESWNLKYYTKLGPGAGFLPFWVGAVLTVLSLIWLGQISFQSVGGIPGDFIPDRKGSLRLISIFAALVACTLLLNPLGFSLTTLAFLVFLLCMLGRPSLLLTVIIALAGSFGVSYIFQHWLGVLLPKSSIAFLKSLGL